MSRVHVWRSGGGRSAAAADFPASSRASGAWLGFRGFSAKRPACGVEWPELRARRAPGDEDDGVGGGCNDGLSRRGR